MRCISPHGNYSIQVFEQKVSRGVDDRGFINEIEVNPSVLANFEKSGIMDHEIEVALDRFQGAFSGLADGVNPLTRIAVYDTDGEALSHGWSDAFKQKVEDRLRQLEQLHPEQFAVVDMPAKPEPWNSYDEMEADEIIEIAERIKIDPEAVYLYEFENKARQEVLDYFDKRRSGAPAEEVEKPAPKKKISVEA